MEDDVKHKAKCEPLFTNTLLSPIPVPRLVTVEYSTGQKLGLAVALQALSGYKVSQDHSGRCHTAYHITAFPLPSFGWA